MTIFFAATTALLVVAAIYQFSLGRTYVKWTREWKKRALDAEFSRDKLQGQINAMSQAAETTRRYSIYANPADPFAAVKVFGEQVKRLGGVL